MNVTVIPPPQTILERHTPLLRLIVVALQAGTAHVREYAEWKNEEIDRALAAALVRKGAKRYLLSRSQDVANEEDEQPIDYEAEYLSNLGLALSADSVHIRVLRSDNGNMPVPGQSKRRQQFYAQQGTLPFDVDAIATDAPIAGVVNLVLHWSTDRDYNLDKVYLGCPKAGGTTRASVEAHWDELVWRRQDFLAVGGDGTPPTGQAEADVTDLDIFLSDDESATGTGDE